MFCRILCEPVVERDGMDYRCSASRRRMIAADAATESPKRLRSSRGIFKRVRACLSLMFHEEDPSALESSCANSGEREKDERKCRFQGTYAAAATRRRTSRKPILPL